MLVRVTAAGVTPLDLYDPLRADTPSGYATLVLGNEGVEA